MFSSRRPDAPVVRPQPELSRLLLFPHEYERIEAEAKQLPPERVVRQCERLESQRRRLSDRISRTVSNRKADRLKGALRVCEFKLHWLLMIRREQLGTLPRVSELSELSPPD